MRQDIRNKILAELQNNNVMLLGDHGLGKTYLAKQLLADNWIYFPAPNPAKTNLLLVLEKFIHKGRKNKIYKKAKPMQINELCSEIIALKKKIFIVIDEFHMVSELSALSYGFLTESKNIRFLIISNKKYIEKAEKKPAAKRFLWDFKKIELSPLSRPESFVFAGKLFEQYKIKRNDQLLAKIAKNSSGCPLTIKRSVEQVSRGEKPDYLSFGEVQDKGINLFPVFFLFAFVLIGMKYLLRITDDYELANISGFVGIIVFFIIRFVWFKLK